MKIISHKVVLINTRYNIFELRIRTGFLFYNYKTIRVSFLFDFKCSPDIEGLTSIQKFRYEFKIWDYCQDVYEKK